MEITSNLARLDPADPTRYDFALAHLGISGACRGRWVPDLRQLRLLGVCAAAGRSNPNPEGAPMSLDLSSWSRPTAARCSW